MAVVSNVHPPDMIAKLICALKKSNLRVIEDVRSHYAVSAGEQPEGIVSDELRVGRKRAAAAISRSQFEISTFATRHDLSEAFSLWSFLHDCLSHRGPCCMTASV